MRSERLESVRAKNFGPFDEIHLPLGQMRGLYLIEGEDLDRDQTAKNGIGKSAIYDPIFYGLMGKSIESMGPIAKARKVLDDLVSDFPDDDKKRSMLVEIDLGDIKIERGLSPKRFEVHERRDDTWHKVTSTFSQESLEQRWGTNAQSLHFSMRFGGGESGLKSYNAGDAEFHRRIQDTLVQADRISTCLKTTRAKLNAIDKQRAAMDRDLAAAEGKAHSLEHEVVDLENRESEAILKLTGEIATVEERIGNLIAMNLDQLAERAKDYAAKSKERAEADGKFIVVGTEAQSMKEKVVELKNKVTCLEKRISELQDAYAAFETEAVTAQRDAKNAQDAVEDARALLVQFKSIITKKRDLEDTKRIYEDRIRTIDSEIKGLQKQVDRDLPLEPEDADLLQRQIAKLDEDMIAAREERRKIEARLADLEALNHKRELLNQKADSEMCQMKERQGLVKELQDEIASMQELRPGTNCPTCRGEITPQHVEAAVAVVQKKIDAIEEKIQEHTRVLVALRSDRENFELEMKNHLGADAKLAENNKLITRIEKDTRDARTRLDGSRSKKIAYDQAVMAKRQAETEMVGKSSSRVTAVAERDKCNVELEALALPEDDLEAAIKKAEKKAEETGRAMELKIQGKARTIGQIEAAQSSIEEALVEVARATQSYKAKKSEAIEIHAKIEGLDDYMSTLLNKDGTPPYSPDRVEVMRNNLAEATVKLNELRAKEQSGVYSELIEKKKYELESAKENLKKLVTDSAKLEEEIPYLRFWAQGFGPDGIRPVAMAEMIPVLNTQLMRYMSLLHGHQVGLKFDEQLDLLYTDWETGEPMRYARLSSGMKMRANIAIALAFRETIKASSNCFIPVFISDESGDSLDEAGMDGYINCLEEIGKDSTVFVITHHPFFRERVKAVASGRIFITHQNKKSSMIIE